MTESLLVSATWVRDHLQDPDVLVVDTSGTTDFAERHIPGAISLPSGDLFEPEAMGSHMRPVAQLEELLGTAGVDAQRFLVLYDSSGLVPSAKVFWVLEHLGRSRVALLNGGFPGWVSQGLPTEQGVASPPPATFHAAPRAGTTTGARSNVAHKEDVLAALGRDDTRIIDTRTPEEYHGRTDAHVRNGHIPGAYNVDWQQHIVDLFDPTLIPAPNLAELYAHIGVNSDTPIITYCRTASRSSHTYFVLRMLGYENVRNYAGSWMEWSADESLPIE